MYDNFQRLNLITVDTQGMRYWGRAAKMGHIFTDFHPPSQTKLVVFGAEKITEILVK